MMNAMAEAKNRPDSPLGQGLPLSRTMPGTKKRISSCSIRGVPRIIQTTVLVSQRRGVNRLMEPKEIIRPSGSAPISVTKNNFKVCRKPSFRAPMTVKNMSMESSFSVIS